MACPFFVPREILNDGSWPHPSRLPLGAGWRGTCCAQRQEEASDLAIDALYVRDFCNLGYAKECPHFPHNRDWDAVRFSIASSSDDQLTLCYTCELDYVPVEHGTLIYDLAGNVWRVEARDQRVRRLADSYVRAYRSRQASLI